MPTNFLGWKEMTILQEQQNTKAELTHRGLIGEIQSDNILILT